MLISAADKPLDLSRPRVMGILNLTPDSFYDGNAYLQREQALTRVQQMVEEGAAIIDIGGESTRPGAAPVSVQEELDRVMPIIEAVHHEFPVPISIDTYKPQVMKEAINAGVNIINDVHALQIGDALKVVADSGVAVCLMHMKGVPKTMQESPYYENPVTEIAAFLEERITACVAAGIEKERIIVDPGFGFGKTIQHNFALINHLATFKKLARPILIGVSRKASIGKILNALPEERLFGSIAMAVLAVRNGALIVRAHDVKPTVDALSVTYAVMQGLEEGN